MQSIYLDYNSTTPVAGGVREAILPFYGTHFGDPSNNHWTGRVAHEAIEDARCSVANLLGCHPTEIVFTSGGTESVNLALLGAASIIDEELPSERHHLVISDIEHLAVSKCAERLVQFGWEVTQVPCDGDGTIDLRAVADSIRSETRIVSVMHANHEVGSIQPIDEISSICAGKRILLHTDAAQTAGKVSCNVHELGVDLLSLSGHKMYAPKGVGALFIRNGTRLNPQTLGEWQESGLRGGMENVPHIVGLGAACRLAESGLEQTKSRLAFLRDLLIEQVRSRLQDSVHLHAERAARLCSTISIAFRDCCADELLRGAPEICAGPLGHDGYQGSTSGISKTLAAMNVEPELAKGTMRLSVGWNTTEDEIYAAADSLANAYERLMV